MRKAPLLILRYLGKMKAKSLEVAMELVEILVPRVARPLVISDYLPMVLAAEQGGSLERSKDVDWDEEVDRGREEIYVQSGSTEESSSPVIPSIDDLSRIPVEGTVDSLTCRCDHYPSASLTWGEVKGNAYQYR